MEFRTQNSLDIALNLPSDDYKIMVLLVDDQVMVGEAIRRALADQPNIDFHYCAQADDAIKLAEQTKPTVILQDLVMPGVDGLTLARQYRLNPATRNVPIIVLSTKDDPAIKSAAFAAGVNDYLVKLPDKIELVARIRYHSRSYINLLQRDAAYRALRESQQKLQESNLELQRLTNTDGLTGIANRRYFDEYMAAEWRRATREQTELSVLLIDVDNFKLYNDSYGHVAGDEVLRQVATTIDANSRRPADLTARFGGEEFAIILPSTSAGGVRLLGEKVRRAVEELVIRHAQSINRDWVTVSIGGATIVPQEGDLATRLIEAADLSLYSAKRSGKNRVVVAE
ncbi:diguanylate cyclase [Undibacterium arcticum]|uniref:diguanylate cyclase n=1 Tax=Undibacterium arcticum TaxID=1762892 RepID=A0ABV7F0P5_9BURK